MEATLLISITSTFFFAIVAIALSMKSDKNNSGDKLDSQPAKNKDEYLHMMVHELRAPLTSIKDSSELLLSIRSSLKEEEQEQFMKIINRQSKVLLEQIASILDSARIESGTFVLFKKKESIQDIIYEKIKLFEAPAEKKNITVSSHIEGPIPTVSIDGLRIGQAINNLLSNSIKFTPAGGQISVTAKVSGGNIEVAVKDSGVGIPKENQKSIFTKFYQVKTAGRQEEKDGSGLGLYIVKKIIDAHHGKVFIESEEGKGTSMCFVIPIESEETKVNTKTNPIRTAQFTLPN